MTLCLSLFALLIPTFLAVIVFEYGLMASLYIATAYIMIIGVAFYLRFLTGKWKAMRVIEPSLPAKTPVPVKLRVDV